MVDVMSSSGIETAFRASTYVTHLRPSLFPGGVGKTWKDGDFEKLLGDVRTRVFDVYGDSTVVYPGHGDDTTLGAERPHLDEWKERGW
jgi:glyoxylase-like metal-dependent hydrolase (beta-lactamase superfamily II)